MDDLRSRIISERVQLTTDGHTAYLRAVDDAFGIDVDYAMLNKVYQGTKLWQARHSPPICISTKTKVIEGNPDPADMSTP